jgi:simple sugar transport system permease protein
MKWFRSAPTWFRWAAYSALGVLVLTLVQGLDDTNQLTSASSSQSMLRWAVPILLAGLGGLFSERAGIVNIGLEGMMILGTWFGAWGGVTFGPWWGIVLGILGGALGGLLHAIATVSFGVDHVISGVAINILAPGIARFLASEIFTSIPGGSITQSPRVPGVGNVTFAFLAGGNFGTWKSPNLLGWLADKDWFFVSDLASLGLGMVSRVSHVTLIALVLVPFTAWLMWRTRFGLRLRICGERPEAGESQGVNVYRYKYLGVVISGALAGLAGAFIASPELSGIYLQGQTAGRGFIGLAALIFGNWRPYGVLGGALLFGYPFGIGLRDLSGAASHSLILVNAIGLAGVAIWAFTRDRRTDAVLAGLLSAGGALWYFSTDFVPDVWKDVLPFVLVLLVLIFFAQRLRPPAADGLRFRKGES